LNTKSCARYFTIKGNRKVRLTKFPAKLASSSLKGHQNEKLLDNNRAALEEYQTLLYAGHERAMLVIFQGMDTAGKDGAIKHVMSGVNPQGCSVVSFKAPSSNELAHDFLWRGNIALPVRGQIGIFNRSYYEEVLVPRVHPEVLEKEKIPNFKDLGHSFWKFRYRDIVNYEKYLYRQGYEVIKIFIHISKDEQKRRLLERFRDPKKVWKISEGDVRERSFWKEYQVAYEECIAHTASKSSPWYIVPGDSKDAARLGISQILVDRFSKMQLDYPKLKKEEKKKLQALKSLLAKD